MLDGNGLARWDSLWESPRLLPALATAAAGVVVGFLLCKARQPCARKWQSHQHQDAAFGSSSGSQNPETLAAPPLRSSAISGSVRSPPSACRTESASGGFAQLAALAQDGATPSPPCMPAQLSVTPYLDYTTAFIAGMDHDRQRRLERMHACQLAWSHEVYGGAAAAEAAGFKLPPPNELAQHIDWPTWEAYIRQVTELLQQNDIEQVDSPSRRRLERLVRASMRTIPNSLTEKWPALRHLRAAGFFANECLDAFAAAAGAEDDHRLLRLELESVEAECSLDAPQSEADYEAQRRIIDGIRLTPEQLAALEQGWDVLRTECREIETDRSQLVASLRQCLAGQEVHPATVTQYAQQLRINMQDEVAAIVTWKCWIMCELVTPLQHARAMVTATPYVWDAVLTCRIMCEGH